MAETPAPTPPAAPKKSKAGLVAVAIGLVALVAGAAGGFFLQPKITEAIGKNDAVAGEAGSPESAAEAADRSLTDLGDFTVNLRDATGERLLQMAVSLESAPADKAAIDERLAEVKDAILLLASDFTYDDLDGIDGKLRLRDEMLSRLNAVLAPHVIRKVYFTAFVVQ